MLVNHFLENSAARLPNKVALICGNERLTYKEINVFADQVAAGIVKLGVKRQDRVAIFIENSAESVIAMFAVLKAGAAFIMLNPTMKAKKLNYILKDSGTRALITQVSKSKTIIKALHDTPDLENIIWIDKIPVELTQVHSHCVYHTWDTVLNYSPGNSYHAPLTGPIDIDLATIIYTSGSTGEPKGVMSAHYNVFAAVRSITTYLENKENDIVIDALPLSFDYGLYQIFMVFFFGGTVVLEKSFVYPYRVLERIVKERATGFPIVPTMVAVFLQMENLSDLDLTSLRYISNTASALPVSHIKKLRVLFPRIRIYSMYGLTECKRVSYLPPEELDRRPESVGIAMPNTEVFVVDDSGAEVGPDEIGELVVRGANVMQGYWNAPEETKRVFRKGKYRADTLLYSGDYFKKDEDGFLFFVSRKDDLIKSKGERISPKEIENAICEIEGVIEAAAIGVPDELFGQAIKLFVVVSDNLNLTENDIRKYCTRNLEPFMHPKYVVFCKELPKSSSGKIEKKKLS